MNATNRNAAQNEAETQQDAGPVVDTNDQRNELLDQLHRLSDEEVANHQLVKLKRIFDRVETELCPEREPRTAPRRRPRPAAKRRNSPLARPHRRAATGGPSEIPDRAAHEAHCSICRHPDRADIEEEFLHWLSPRTMREFFGVESRAVYRHAHAFNLFAARDRNLRFALGHIIDRAERVPDLRGPDIIRAVHAFAHINAEGQWVEPPSHVIVSSGSRPATQQHPQIGVAERPPLRPTSEGNPGENPASLLDTLSRTEHNAND
jgi:hypothetical protein